MKIKAKVPSRVMRAIANAAHANGAHGKPWFTSYYGGTWPCRHKLHHISITPKERYVIMEYYDKSHTGEVTLKKNRYSVSSGFDMDLLCWTLQGITKAIKRTPPKQ